MNRYYDQYQGLLNTFILGSEDLRILLDTANAKYNRASWRNFATFDVPQIGKSFKAIIEETNIIVRASLLSPSGKKPLRSTEGGELYTGSIPKIGHGFKIDQADINFFKELGQVEGDVNDWIARTYINRAAKIIGGFHATWTGWIYQALSTGWIKVTKDQNPDGIPLNVGMKVKPSHMIGALTKVWSDPDADIIGSLQRMVKIATDDSIPFDYIGMTKELFDNVVCKNKNVIEALKGRMLIREDILYPFTTREIKERLASGFDLPPIVLFDERSRFESDGIPVDGAPSFDPNAAILLKAGYFFGIKNSPDDYREDKNPAVITSSTENGHIGAIKIFGSEPINVITNMEAWAFPVMKNPNNIVIMDTSKVTA